jgi:glycosyltransferase involved in cell wall biosynthesis
MRRGGRRIRLFHTSPACVVLSYGVQHAAFHHNRSPRRSQSLAPGPQASINCARRARQTNQTTSRVNAPPSVRILAMMEAVSVTGPAKNLIGFCRWLDTAEGAQTGLRIAIATFERAPNSAQNQCVDATRAAGIETHIVGERYRFDLGAIPQLRRIVGQTRPDIIQTHNGKSHLLIKALRDLRAHRLWFAFQHGYQHTDLKLRLYNQLDRLSLRSADRVVSVCQAFAPRLIAYGVSRERIRVLHNAAVPTPVIPERERAQLRTRLGIRDGESVLLTIGRLSREKGHADLLQALGRFRPAGRDWKLVIVGFGPEREALATLARTLGIDQQVVFAGFHADVSRYYAVANLFVLPSHSEGSSNVLLESMMAGVPIVATRAGGNPEIVLHEDTGLLVPVSDHSALAGAIARLLQEPELASRLVKAAHARAASEFSVDRYRQRLAGFYAEALGKVATSPAAAALPSTDSKPN